MELRVWECGKSECRSVTEWIGIEPKGNIIPHESEQTSTWSLITREIDKPTLEVSR